MLIFVGYKDPSLQDRTGQTLVRLIEDLGTDVVWDCRDNPWTRDAFRLDKLYRLLPWVAWYAGRDLGSKRKIQPWAVAQLDEFGASQLVHVLLCHHADPRKCHVPTKIASLLTRPMYVYWGGNFIASDVFLRFPTVRKKSTPVRQLCLPFASRS